jgi:hypothetical protein
MKNFLLSLIAGVCVMCLLLFNDPAQAAVAAINTSELLQAVVWLVVMGIIFGLLWWFIGYAAIPAPFDKVARVVVALAALLIVINVLLSLVGTPLFTLR